MNIKPITTEAEYENALVALERLMDAEPGSEEEKQLDRLSLEIEKYEEEHYFIEMPDAISAIKFRMKQLGLKQIDLIPYFNSQSRVSDVLRKKRGLTQEMIRKLHSGLGIPYEVLLQKPGAKLEEQKYYLEEFPFNQMVRAGYFPGFTDVRRSKLIFEELMEQLFSVFGKQEPQLAYCRHENQKEINPHALLAWQAHILNLIGDETLSDYSFEALDVDFYKSLLNFSNYEGGIKLVKEHLNKVGIHFIAVPHLKQTRLDGAAFLTPKGVPVVAVTLRHDRLDNFWFTLFHELAHVVLHLDVNSPTAYFDEIERQRSDDDSTEEKEADRFAQERMIPPSYWNTHCKNELEFVSINDIEKWAKELRIHQAIVAGRVRFEKHNYRQFGSLIGQGEVRKHFPSYQQAK